MSRAQEDEVRLAERAAQWFGALQESNAERTAVFNWLAESPRHVDAFLETLVTAQEISALTEEQIKRIETLASGEAPAADNIVPLEPVSRSLPPAFHAPSSSSNKSKQPIAGFAVAAAIAALSVAEWLFTKPPVYSTAIGEQRTLELVDGSIVHLNTQSRLKVSYTDATRTIELLEGQASFKVKSDVQRPFVVQSGSTRIQALGTEFDVYQRGCETRVAVIEGAVRISSPTAAAPRLDAGEAAEVRTGGRIFKHKQTDSTQATAWRQRRLVFHEETLGAIAAEFNRYNTDLKIQVSGEAANAEHFSGTFDADAPDTLVRALEGDGTLLIEHTPHEMLIKARPR